MRYVFISDMHGCYDKMIDALNGVNFNPATDTIVSLGDAFDRGADSQAILRFLLSCPNRILIWGNHETRFYEIYCGQPANMYDYSNGLDKTLCSFLNLPMDSGISIEEGITHLKHNPANKEVNDLLNQYFNECHFAAEFKDLIAVHAWTPRYAEDWRNASIKEWNSAVWAHTEWLILCENYPDKKMIFGHWHAWRLAKKFGRQDRIVEIDDVYDDQNNIKDEDDWKIIYDCSMYEDIDGHYIAIDGCSNYLWGGVVNAYVYESDEQPKFYY